MQKPLEFAILSVGSILMLSACVSKKPPAEKPSAASKNPLVRTIHPAMGPGRPDSQPEPLIPPAVEKQKHGVRVIFPRETEAPEGSWVGFVKDGQPYREKLVRHASARMCAIRLQVLCYKNGIEADLDPPFAVKIYQPDLQVQSGNVRCGVQKF